MRLIYVVQRLANSVIMLRKHSNVGSPRPSMTPPSKRLDRIDLAILDLLQKNARITNAELANAVNLSTTPCFNRVRNIEKLGLINQRVTLLNPEMFGLYLNVFLSVSLERQVEFVLRTFEEAISSRPELMECYLMTGTRITYFVLSYQTLRP